MGASWEKELGSRNEHRRSSRTGLARPGRETCAEAGLRGTSSDALVCVPVRVGDEVQLVADHCLERLATTAKRRLERFVVERSESIMVPRVEPDDEMRIGGQDANAVSPKRFVLRNLAHKIGELRRPAFAIFGTQCLDGADQRPHIRADRRKPVSVQQRPQLERSIQGGLKALPPERPAAREAGPGEKERRPKPSCAQQRYHKVNVGAQIVVEGDREREPGSTPAGGGRCGQVARADHPIARSDVAQLRLEGFNAERRRNVTRGIAGRRRYTVVDKNYADTPA